MFERSLATLGKRWAPAGMFRACGASPLDHSPLLKPSRYQLIRIRCEPHCAILISFYPQRKNGLKRRPGANSDVKENSGPFFANLERRGQDARAVPPYEKPLCRMVRLLLILPPHGGKNLTRERSMLTPAASPRRMLVRQGCSCNGRLKTVATL